MELSTAWPLHLITALILLQHGNAIEEPCHACRSVSAELLDRLAKEKPKDALDLRNRLDSQGKRYGRVIQFRLSEQRVHDLLEGLCSVVSKSNMLYTSEEGNQTWAKSAQPGWTAPKKAEEEGRRKELENYCSQVLDKFEDDLIIALKQESGDLDGILCQQLTGACKSGTSADLDARSEL